MHIAFFGSSLVSAYWNGAATYYRGILKALHARGHTATFYEPDAYERQQHVDHPDPPYARDVVYEPTAAAMRRCLDEAGETADVVVKASGVGVFDRELEAAVLELKRPGRKVVFWDVDAPATLDRTFGDEKDPFREQVPQFDAVLTYGGGPPVVDAYTRLGAKTCVPIYNALDPDTHHPVPPDGRFACELALLANRLPDREARVGEFFLKPAQTLSDLRFLLGGSGWDPASLPANVRAIGHVSPVDHNALNCTPLAVLNVSRDSMARYGFSPATRVFEAGRRRGVPHHRRLGGRRGVPGAGGRDSGGAGRGRGRGAGGVADARAGAADRGSGATQGVGGSHLYAEGAGRGGGAGVSGGFLRS